MPKACTGPVRPYGALTWLCGKATQKACGHLLIVDEVGYLPLERQAANLLFTLVSPRLRTRPDRRHQQPRLRAMGRDPRRRHGRSCPDRPLVHHATMITLKGKSYRLRELGIGVAPAAQAPSLRNSA
jgi:hypothetical protein